MMQSLLGFFKNLLKPTPLKPIDPKFKEQIKDAHENVSSRLRSGDPKTWHHIFMGAVITMTGFLAIFAIFANSLLDSQRESLTNHPVISDSANSVLPQGSYRIFQMEETESDTPMFLVAPKDGGVLVAVYPPDGSIPADMTPARATTSILLVQEDGRWVFQTP